MPGTDPDFLIVGSGLAALSFAALMAKAGHGVRVIEAHTEPGGYGHTFAVGDYKFNAQLHYVWNCGEGRTVHRVLKKLGLEREVTFVEYDRNGFDHMRMPGYALDIPGDQNLLKQRLRDLFPLRGAATDRFVDEAFATADELDNLPNPRTPGAMLRALPRMTRILRYRKATLQAVFDRFEVPAPAQTLLALQWPDFLLPPGELSFFAWVMLFVGYCRGAYYPTHHFEHVITSLVRTIEEHAGEVVLGQQVIAFESDTRGRVIGVCAEEVGPGGEGTGVHHRYRGGQVVCNMDPRKAAEMIGLDRFSTAVRRKLDYDYSHSNFMAYVALEGIDLRDYGFGRHNLFHTDESDLNAAFASMLRGDYSRPSFAMTTPSLLTESPGDCPEGTQLVELLTVASFDRFQQLRFANMRAYHGKKREIYETIVKVIERDYVPDFGTHVRFKMLGSPTTNQRYCWSPRGHSYGSNMTPNNIGPGRLDHRSSVPGLHFCSASAGFAGFTGAIWTGGNLYEHLTGDRFL